MKHLSKPNLLSWLCAGAGLVCLLLRQWLISTGMSAAGLMDHTHPGYWLSWLLAIVILLILALSLRYRVRIRFAPTKLRALGLVLTALGFLAAALSLRSFAHPLRLPSMVLGFAAGLCCLWRLWCLCRKKRIHPLFYAPGILFLLLFMVCRYSTWSAEPELQLCFFHMTALGGLALSAFRRGSVALDRRAWKGYLQLSRWAIFASLAAIPGCEDPLPLALWALGMLLDGCSAAPQRDLQ